MPDSDKVIDELRLKIADAISKKKEGADWAICGLQYCITLVEELREENSALWFMLEEMKKSKWQQEHTEELNRSITDHLKMLRLMQTKKGEA
tara:strand:- start:12264 stop:12539 length:276 start_codon:yes stop_codon:yes gene_type:complete